MYNYKCFDKFGAVVYESASNQHPLHAAKFHAEGMLLAPDCYTAALCQAGKTIYRKLNNKNWSKVA